MVSPDAAVAVAVIATVPLTVEPAVGAVIEMGGGDEAPRARAPRDKKVAMNSAAVAPGCHGRGPLICANPPRLIVRGYDSRDRPTGTPAARSRLTRSRLALQTCSYDRLVDEGSEEDHGMHA